MKVWAVALLAALSLGMSGTAGAETIPALHAVALNGRSVELPRDLSQAGTVLILGFTRGSEDATTEWGRHVRNELANSTGVGFYEMPMLASVPSFLRGVVTRSIRKKVPEVLHPNFVPLTQDEDRWKRLAGYSKDAQDAAYVLLVDHGGNVRWMTHATFSAITFAELSAETRKLRTTP